MLVWCEIKRNRLKQLLLYIIFGVFSIGTCVAQTTDSLVAHDLKQYGVKFSSNNSVTLLTTGQEKFDDMFKAIRQAKKSIHLEYFNFRNDSIAGLLFHILEQKAKEGVEVRALFDAFGNSSNNRPLKRETSQNYS